MDQKVVQFALRKKQTDYDENEHFNDDGYYVIDTTKKGEDLSRNIGEFWSWIYCGQDITETFADDDGKIYCKLDWSKNKISKDVLLKHISFFMDFINNTTLTREFLDKYEQFLLDTGIERVLAEENKKSPS